MAFEADQTVQKYARQTEMVLLSVSGSPGLLLALLPPCWRPALLRIAAELLAAAQLTVSSICFHSLGQDSLLCSSDTFSRRAAQCNYTVRGGWFSEMWLAPLSSISLNLSLLWATMFLFTALFYEASSFVWEVVIKKELGFFFFFSGSVFSYCSWNNKSKSWLSLISSSLPTSALFTRFCGVLSQLNSAHSFFLFKKIIFFLAAKYNIDFEGGSVKLETLTWNSWFLIYTDTYFYF